MTILRADQVARVTKLVQQASMSSLAWYRDGVAVENKATTGFDPVTEADRSVERDLRAGLEEIFGDAHQIVGEEYGTTGQGRFAWYLDPIDGTRAFVTGQPMWGTLVGLLDTELGKTVAGWMHIPPLGETYVAAGTGSTKRLGPMGAGAISTSSVTELGAATLLSTDPRMFQGPYASVFERLTSQVRLTRFSGDCVNYGLLAEGGADLVVENGLQPYDVMALIPIVVQAGGVITNLDGAEPIEGGYVVAASTLELHKAALDFLN
jgi:histidinol phosphatase-like enzyme (inositol monophosphatase family)